MRIACLSVCLRGRERRREEVGAVLGGKQCVYECERQ